MLGVRLRAPDVAQGGRGGGLVERVVGIRLLDGDLGGWGSILGRTAPGLGDLGSGVGLRGVFVGLQAAGAGLRVFGVLLPPPSILSTLRPSAPLLVARPSKSSHVASLWATAWSRMVRLLLLGLLGAGASVVPVTARLRGRLLGLGFAGGSGWAAGSPSTSGGAPPC